jgi:hypothetical protein
MKREKLHISAAPPTKGDKPDPETFLKTLPTTGIDPATPSVPPDASTPRPSRKNAATARLTSMEAVLADMEPPPMPGKTKKPTLQRLAVDIPADLHAKIKEHASRPGASVREDITGLLNWFYNRAK